MTTLAPGLPDWATSWFLGHCPVGDPGEMRSVADALVRSGERVTEVTGRLELLAAREAAAAIEGETGTAIREALRQQIENGHAQAEAFDALARFMYESANTVELEQYTLRAIGIAMVATVAGSIGTQTLTARINADIAAGQARRRTLTWLVQRGTAFREAFPHLAAAASGLVLGALSMGGATAAAQYAQIVNGHGEPGRVTEMKWKDVVVATAAGAMGGAIGGLVARRVAPGLQRLAADAALPMPTALAALAAGGLSGAAGALAGGLTVHELTGGEVNLAELMLVGAGGGMAAGLGIGLHAARAAATARVQLPGEVVPRSTTESLGRAGDLEPGVGSTRPKTTSANDAPSIESITGDGHTPRPELSPEMIRTGNEIAGEFARNARPDDFSTAARPGALEFAAQHAADSPGGSGKYREIGLDQWQQMADAEAHRMLAGLQGGTDAPPGTAAPPASPSAGGSGSPAGGGSPSAGGHPSASGQNNVWAKIFDHMRSGAVGSESAAPATGMPGRSGSAAGEPPAAAIGGDAGNPLMALAGNVIHVGAGAGLEGGPGAVRGSLGPMMNADGPMPGTGGSTPHVAAAKDLGGGHGVTFAGESAGAQGGSLPPIGPGGPRGPARGGGLSELPSDGDWASLLDLGFLDGPTPTPETPAPRPITGRDAPPTPGRETPAATPEAPQSSPTPPTEARPGPTQSVSAPANSTPPPSATSTATNSQTSHNTPTPANTSAPTTLGAQASGSTATPGTASPNATASPTTHPSPTAQTTPTAASAQPEVAPHSGTGTAPAPETTSPSTTGGGNPSTAATASSGASTSSTPPDQAPSTAAAAAATAAPTAAALGLAASNADPQDDPTTPATPQDTQPHPNHPAAQHNPPTPTTPPPTGHPQPTTPSPTTTASPHSQTQAAPPPGGTPLTSPHNETQAAPPGSGTPPTPPGPVTPATAPGPGQAAPPPGGPPPTPPGPTTTPPVGQAGAPPGGSPPSTPAGTAVPVGQSQTSPATSGTTPPLGAATPSGQVPGSSGAQASSGALPAALYGAFAAVAPMVGAGQQDDEDDGLRDVPDMYPGPVPADATPHVPISFPDPHRAPEFGSPEDRPDEWRQPTGTDYVIPGAPKVSGDPPPDAIPIISHPEQPAVPERPNALPATYTPPIPADPEGSREDNQDPSRPEPIPDVAPLPRDDANTETGLTGPEALPQESPARSRYATASDPRAPGAPQDPSRPPQFNPHSLEYLFDQSGVPAIGGLPTIEPARPMRRRRGPALPRPTMQAPTGGGDPKRRRKNRPDPEPPQPPERPITPPENAESSQPADRRARPQSSSRIRDTFVVRRAGEDTGTLGEEGDRVRAAARAREWVRSLPEKLPWLTEDQVDTTELLISELVANSLRHTTGRVEIIATTTDSEDTRKTRFAITDESQVVPDHTGMPDWDAERGRGGAFVDMLADDNGTDPLPTGKATWFELHQPFGDAPDGPPTTTPDDDSPASGSAEPPVPTEAAAPAVEATGQASASDGTARASDSDERSVADRRLARARQGDPAALQELREQHGADTVRAVLSLLGISPARGADAQSYVLLAQEIARIAFRFAESPTRRWPVPENTDVGEWLQGVAAEVVTEWRQLNPTQRKHIAQALDAMQHGADITLVQRAALARLALPEPVEPTANPDDSPETSESSATPPVSKAAAEAAPEEAALRAAAIAEVAAEVGVDTEIVNLVLRGRSAVSEEAVAQVRAAADQLGYWDQVTKPDVARAAGLSLETVDKVLGNRGGRLDEHTRQRVLTVAAEIGYTGRITRAAVARQAGVGVATVDKVLRDGPVLTSETATAVREAARRHGLLGSPSDTALPQAGRIAADASASQVAEQAGVSEQHVYRVLRGEGKRDPETAARVLDAADRVGFRVRSPGAPNLRPLPRSALTRAMETLPDDIANYIDLRYLQHRSTNDIRAALGTDADYEELHSAALSYLSAFWAAELGSDSVVYGTVRPATVADVAWLAGTTTGTATASLAGEEVTEEISARVREAAIRIGLPSGDPHADPRPDTPSGLIFEQESDPGVGLPGADVMQNSAARPRLPATEPDHATVADVARMADVDVATAHWVLLGGAGHDIGTVRRVLDAADNLEYRHRVDTAGEPTETAHGQPVTLSELAQRAAVSDAQVRDVLAGAIMSPDIAHRVWAAVRAVLPQHEPGTPEDAAVVAVPRAALEYGISKLPERLATFAALRYLDGYTPAEATATLGLSAAASQRIGQAVLRQLSHHLPDVLPVDRSATLRRVRIDDVAQAAGASRAAAQRVIRGTQTVDPDLARRVWDMVAHFGFRRLRYTSEPVPNDPEALTGLAFMPSSRAVTEAPAGGRSPTTPPPGPTTGFVPDFDPADAIDAGRPRRRGAATHIPRDAPFEVLGFNVDPRTGLPWDGGAGPPQPVAAPEAGAVPPAADLVAAVDPELLSLVREGIAAEHEAAQSDSADVVTHSEAGQFRRLDTMLGRLDELRGAMDQPEAVTARRLQLLVQHFHAAAEWLAALLDADSATRPDRRVPHSIDQQARFAEEAVDRYRSANDRVDQLAAELATPRPGNAADPAEADLSAAVDPGLLRLVRDGVAAEHEAAVVDPRNAALREDVSRYQRLHDMLARLDELIAALDTGTAPVTPGRLRLLVHHFHATAEWLAALTAADNATEPDRQRPRSIHEQDLHAVAAVDRVRAADERLDALDADLRAGERSAGPPAVSGTVIPRRVEGISGPHKDSITGLITGVDPESSSNHLVLQAVEARGPSHLVLRGATRSPFTVRVDADGVTVEAHITYRDHDDGRAEAWIAHQDPDVDNPAFPAVCAMIEAALLGRFPGRPIALTENFAGKAPHTERTLVPAEPPAVPVRPSPARRQTGVPQAHDDELPRTYAEENLTQEDLGSVAAASDRSPDHPLNEDAFALVQMTVGGEEVVGIVLLDGTSRPKGGHRASAAGKEAAHDSVVAALERADREGGLDPVTVVRDAVAAAQAAVLGTVADSGTKPPAATIVVALVESGRLTVDWIGDSRAYWVPLDGGPAIQLTTDDSNVQKVMDALGMPREEAKHSAIGKGLTYSLGRSLEGLESHAKTFEEVRGNGVVVVITDGIWESISPDDPEPLADILREALSRSGGDLSAVPRAYVRAAINAGGRDDATVAVARVTGTTPGSTEKAKDTGDSVSAAGGASHPWKIPPAAHPAAGSAPHPAPNATTPWSDVDVTPQGSSQPPPASPDTPTATPAAGEVSGRIVVATPDELARMSGPNPTVAGLVTAVEVVDGTNTLVLHAVEAQGPSHLEMKNHLDAPWLSSFDVGGLTVTCNIRYRLSDRGHINTWIVHHDPETADPRFDVLRHQIDLALAGHFPGRAVHVDELHQFGADWRNPHRIDSATRLLTPVAEPGVPAAPQPLAPGQTRIGYRRRAAQPGAYDAGLRKARHPVPTATPSRTEYDGAKATFRPGTPYGHRTVDVIVLDQDEAGVFCSGVDRNPHSTNGKRPFLLLRKGALITSSAGEHPDLLNAYLAEHADEDERWQSARHDDTSIVAGYGWWEMSKGKPELVDLFSGTFYEDSRRSSKARTQVLHRLGERIDLSTIRFKSALDAVGPAWWSPAENDGDAAAANTVPEPGEGVDLQALTAELRQHLRGGTAEFSFEVESVHTPHGGGLSIDVICQPVLGEPARATIDVSPASTTATAQYSSLDPGAEPERTYPALRTGHEVLTDWLTASGFTWAEGTEQLLTPPAPAPAPAPPANADNNPFAPNHPAPKGYRPRAAGPGPDGPNPFLAFHHNPENGREWTGGDPDKPGEQAADPAHEQGNPEPSGSAKPSRESEPSPENPAATPAVPEPTAEPSESEPSGTPENTKTNDTLIHLVRTNPAVGVRLGSEFLNDAGFELMHTMTALYFMEHGGPGVAGAIGWATQLPYLGGALIAGHLADHTSLKKLLIGSQAVAAAGGITATAALAAGTTYAVPILIGTTLMGAASSVLYTSAADKVIIDMVGEAQDGLARFNNLKMNITRVLGRGLGPLALKNGAWTAPLIDTGTSLVNLATLWKLPPTPPQASESESRISLRDSIVEGVHAVQKLPLRRRQNTNLGLTNFYLGMQGLQFTAMITESGLSEWQQGAALLITPLGGVVGNLIPRKWLSGSSIETLLTARLAGLAVPAIIQAATHDPWVASAGFAGTWAVLGAAGIPITAYMNKTIPSDVRGRVRAITVVTTKGTYALGPAVAGGAIALFGSEATGISIAATFGTIASWSLYKRLFKAKKLLDCINQTSEAIWALGLDNRKKPKKWQKSPKHLQEAISTQLVEIEFDPATEDPVARTIADVRNMKDGADTAVLLLGNGPKMHSLTITNTDNKPGGNVVVFDTNITEPGDPHVDPADPERIPRIRTVAEWKESYPDIDAAFVAFLTTDDDDNLTNLHPHDPDLKAPPKDGKVRGPLGNEVPLPPEFAQPHATGGSVRFARMKQAILVESMSGADNTEALVRGRALAAAPDEEWRQAIDALAPAESRALTHPVPAARETHRRAVGKVVSALSVNEAAEPTPAEVPELGPIEEYRHFGSETGRALTYPEAAAIIDAALRRLPGPMTSDSVTVDVGPFLVHLVGFDDVGNRRASMENRVLEMLALRGVEGVPRVYYVGHTFAMPDGGHAMVSIRSGMPQAVQIADVTAPSADLVAASIRHIHEQLGGTPAEYRDPQTHLRELVEAETRCVEPLFAEFGDLLTALEVPREPFSPVLDRLPFLDPERFRVLLCEPRFGHLLVAVVDGRLVVLDREFAKREAQHHDRPGLIDEAEPPGGYVYGGDVLTLLLQIQRIIHGAVQLDRTADAGCLTPEQVVFTRTALLRAFVTARPAWRQPTTLPPVPVTAAIGVWHGLGTDMDPKLMRALDDRTLLANLAAGFPARETLAEAFRNAIRSGGLAPHQPLPSAAQLAGHFGISPATAGFVYAALRGEGLVTTRQGSGTVVAAHVPTSEAAAPVTDPAFAVRGVVTAANVAEMLTGRTNVTDLADGLRAAIHSGELPVGWKLPGVKELAGDLGVSGSTVARTYRQLAAQGHLAVYHGAGTVVANRAANRAVPPGPMGFADPEVPFDGPDRPWKPARRQAEELGILHIDGGGFGHGVAREPRSAAGQEEAGTGDREPQPNARETAVLNLVYQGLTPTEIAERLGTSPGSVKSHQSRAAAKLGTAGAIPTVLEAKRRGFIDDGDAPAIGTVRLSEDQRELLGFMAQGLSDESIARRLGVSPATVQRRRDGIGAAVGTKGSVPTFMATLRLGILDDTGATAEGYDEVLATDMEPELALEISPQQRRIFGGLSDRAAAFARARTAPDSAFAAAAGPYVSDLLTRATFDLTRTRGSGYGLDQLRRAGEVLAEIRTRMPDEQAVADAADAIQGLCQGLSRLFEAPRSLRHRSARMRALMLEQLGPGTPAATAVEQTVALLRRSAAADAPPAPSAREREVLELVGAGRGNGEIAAELGISTGTVEQHLKNIRRKAGGEHREDQAPAAIPLSARENEILRLHREGKTTAEIAAALGCAPGTVRTHFRRIRYKGGTDLVVPEQTVPEALPESIGGFEARQRAANPPLPYGATGVPDPDAPWDGPDRPWVHPRAQAPEVWHIDGGGFGLGRWRRGKKAAEPSATEPVPVEPAAEPVVGSKPEAPQDEPVSVRELLATNKPYRQLYISNAVTGLGDSIQQSSLPLLAMGLTGDPMAAGLTAFALWTPAVLFELPAGYVADFYDRGKTMRIAQWAGMASVAGTGAAVALGAPDIGLILAGATLVEVTAARFYARSLQGTVRDLVTPGQLPSANRMTEVERYVAGTGGRVLGPILLGINQVLPFAVNGVSFAINQVSLSKLRGSLPPRAPRERRPFRHALVDIREGASQIWHDPFLRLYTGVTPVTNVAATILNLRAAAIVDEAALPGIGAGLVLGAGAIGGVVGGLFLPNRLINKTKVGVLYPAALATFTGVAALQSATTNPLLVAVGALGVSLVGVGMNVRVATHLQQEVPHELYGRSSSAKDLVLATGTALGGLVGGAVLSSHGVDVSGQLSVALIGGAAVVVTAQQVITRSRHRLEQLRRLFGLRRRESAVTPAPERADEKHTETTSFTHDRGAANHATVNHHPATVLGPTGIPDDPLADFATPWKPGRKRVSRHQRMEMLAQAHIDGGGFARGDGRPDPAAAPVADMASRNDTRPRDADPFADWLHGLRDRGIDTEKTMSDLAMIWDFLRHDPKWAFDRNRHHDAVILFGSPDDGSAAVVANLTREHGLDEIPVVFSGYDKEAAATGNPQRPWMSEATRFRLGARQAGLGDHHVIEEPLAENTRQNAIRSVALLEEHGHTVDSVIAVCTPQHARRVWATIDRQCPEVRHISVVTAPVSVDNYIRYGLRSDTHADPHPHEVVTAILNEVSGLLETPRKGLITAQPIPHDILLAYRDLTEALGIRVADNLGDHLAPRQAHNTTGGTNPWAAGREQAPVGGDKAVPDVGTARRNRPVPDRDALPKVRAAFEEAFVAADEGDNTKLAKLRAAVEQVRVPVQREVLLLRFAEHLTFRQIIEATGGFRSEASIKQLHNRAVQALAGILDAEHDPGRKRLTGEQLLDELEAMTSRDDFVEQAAREGWRSALESGLRQAIRSGRLREGRRLPPARELAAAISHPVATAAAVYTRLGAEGYLMSTTKGGTRVAPREHWPSEPQSTDPAPHDATRGGEAAAPIERKADVPRVVPSARPATDTGLLHRLFPTGVHTAEDIGATHGSILSEWRCTVTALEGLGRADEPMPADADGQPQWPVDLVKATTRTAGFTGVAIAETRTFRAIGLDAERDVTVRPDLMRNMTSAQERSRIRDLAFENSAMHWDQVHASAKNNVVGLHSRLTGHPVRHNQVEITLRPDAADSTTGTFEARVSAGHRAADPSLTVLSGRFRVRDGIVVTAIALPRSNPPPTSRQW